MKQLELGSSIFFLSLKNEVKIFSPEDIQEKGGPALEWPDSEHSTFYLDHLEISIY